MRILVLVRRFYPYVGGGEIVLRQIFTNLAMRGHTIYIVTSRLENTPEYEEMDGLQIYRPYSSGTSLTHAVFFLAKLFPYLKITSRGCNF
jgi:hypothetical protein